MSESVAPPKAALISPLGHAPGAVSGVYYALHHQGIPVERVVAISSRDEKVRKAAEYVRRALPREVEYQSILLPMNDYRDGKRATMVYQRVFAWQVRLAQSQGYAVHVAVTGGRSGMGATAAMVAQFFGAQGLWHLWVRQDIEDSGQVDKIPDSPTPENLYLNPLKAGEDAWELVAVPFVDLSDWRTHPDRWAACCPAWPPERRREMMAMVRQISTLIEKDAWEQIRTRLQEWPTLSREDKIRVAEALEDMLVEGGLLAPGSRLAQVLVHARTVAELEASLGPYDLAGLFAQIRDWIKEHPSESLSAGMLFLQALELLLKVLGIIS